MFSKRRVKRSTFGISIGGKEDSVGMLSTIHAFQVMRDVAPEPTVVAERLYTH